MSPALCAPDSPLTSLIASRQKKSGAPKDTALTDSTEVLVVET